MPKRTFTMAIAVALFASLALSAPSQAGFVTTVTAFNSGAPADDLEVIFNGTGGSISNINVSFSGAPVGSTEVIASGDGVKIDFSSPLATASAVQFTFDSVFAPASISSAEWTFKSGAPVSAPDVSFITTMASVPEPSAIVLLGVGMAGLFVGRRFFKRSAAA
jgi:hypothetical protein